jgi:NADH dehydrogenase (ubiquinone) 1 alpha subcomplex subunit 5
VDHHAPQKIIDLNQALLDKMAASDMPETAQYRITLETIARYRMKVCEEHFEESETIEGLIECGQVEELVEQAKDEMEVLDMYLENRLWEKIKPNEVEVNFNPDPSKDQYANDKEREE